METKSVGDGGVGGERRIVAIGASAGGLDPLMAIVAELPADLPAAVLVVVHVPPHAPSALPRVLSRKGPLPAEHAVDGEAIAPGTIRVAPPDRHLLVEDGRLRVVRGPRENRSRPAVDPLFRSAALAHGADVVGVVLSGALDDGAAGLAVVRRMGGVTVVQDPAEALYPDMPAAALRAASPDHCLPASDIGRLIERLAAAPPDGSTLKEVAPMERTADIEEARLTAMDARALHATKHPGEPSVFGCPDCGGTLWELSDEASMFRFRCRVGHSFSADALFDGQQASVEAGLWTALRALEEQAALADRLAIGAGEGRQGAAADRFREHAEDVRTQAEAVRGLILRGRGMAGSDESDAVAVTSAAHG